MEQEKITDIISITPQHLRQHNWNYIDNIKYVSVYNGYLNDFGEGTHLDIEYISGECEKISIEDTAYLLNDNGKTIETLNKGKPINYDRHKVAILMKYIKGEYNRSQLFKELDLYYSGADKEVSEE